MEFGKLLKDARISKGFSLEFVEEETKIRKYYIDALENDDYSVLPPQVYACGFVKRYAKLLGLDPQVMVGNFKRFAYDQEVTDDNMINDSSEEIQSTTVLKPKKIFWRRKNILFAIAFLIFAIWAGNYTIDYITGSWQNKSDNNFVPMLPDKTPIADHQQNDASPSNTGQEQTISESKVRIEIDVNEKCWLTVIVDGKQEIAAILWPGDHKSFVGNESVFIHAGNAGGIKVKFNDQEVPPLGGQFEVVKKEFKNN